MNDTPLPENLKKELQTIGDNIKLQIGDANSAKATLEQEAEKISKTTSLKTLEEVSAKSKEKASSISEFLAAMKKEYKNTETKRKEYVDPLNATVKKINDNFKVRTVPLKQAIDMVDRGLSLYLNAEDDKRIEIQADIDETARKKEEKAAKKLEEAKKEGDEKKIAKAEKKVEKIQEAEPEMVEQAQTKFQTASGTISGRKDWTFDVEDISKVPIKYLEVVRKLVMLDIHAGERKIPGLKIYQKTGIATRT